MSPLSFFGKVKKEVFLALDIGTEAVKALAVERIADKMVVRGASLSYFDKFGVFNGRNCKTAVIKKAVLDVLQNIQKETGGRIESTILGLSPQVLKARVVLQTLRRDDSEKLISGNEEKRIYNRVFESARKKIGCGYSDESGILSAELEFLNSRILEIKIDGYKVEKIKGYGGKNLEFRILSSFLPKNYLRDFQTIVKEMDLKITKIVHPLENLNLIFNEESGIFLDIGGETTQFCLMEKGVPAVIDEFAAGGHNFSEAVANNLGLHEETARVFKERYSAGCLSEDARERVEKFFSPVFKEWFSLLKEGLREREHNNLVYLQIYIYGGGSRLFGIKDYLAEESGLDAREVSVEDLPGIEKKIPFLEPLQYFNAILLGYVSK